MSRVIESWLCSSLVMGVLCACGPSSNVPSASCQSTAVTETLCKEWGAGSGCKTSSYVSGSASSPAGCTFSDCDEPPSCDSSYSAHDAGTKDAGLDPACKTADPDGDGLFSTQPPCSNPHTLTVNGATSYTCPCASACPCGYECGSIALASGGVVSSVCAPAK